MPECAVGFGTRSPRKPLARPHLQMRAPKAHPHRGTPHPESLEGTGPRSERPAWCHLAWPGFSRRRCSFRLERLFVSFHVRGNRVFPSGFRPRGLVPGPSGARRSPGGIPVGMAVRDSASAHHGTCAHGNALPVWLVRQI